MATCSTLVVVDATTTGANRSGELLFSSLPDGR
jgi:hypothetical protein